MSQSTDLARAQERFARRQRLVALARLAALGRRRSGRSARRVHRWLFYFSSVLAVSGVKVAGADTVPVATITQIAAAPLGTPLAKVDLTAIADRVRTIQSVADAQVTRAWPNQLKIVVTERVPVVVVTDGSNFELVDATGVAFKTVPARPEDLPEALVVGTRAGSHDQFGGEGFGGSAGDAAGPGEVDLGCLTGLDHPQPGVQGEGGLGQRR